MTALATGLAAPLSHDGAVDSIAAVAAVSAVLLVVAAALAISLLRP